MRNNRRRQLATTEKNSEHLSFAVPASLMLRLHREAKSRHLPLSTTARILLWDIFAALDHGGGEDLMKDQQEAV